MNLLMIWLIVSGVSTVFVLLSVRSAPTWEDEPLNIPDESIRKFDTAHDAADHRAAGFRKQPRKVIKSERGKASPPHPKLSNFAIIRSEETQS